MQAIPNNNEMLLSNFDVDIEEPDTKFIPHALNTVCSGARRVGLLYHDTYVTVFGLNYWDFIKSYGLQELWIRVSVGNTTKYIALLTCLSWEVGYRCL